MESDFLSQNMRISHHGFRFLFFPLCPKLSPSVQFLEKPRKCWQPLLLNNRYKSSCRALNVSEKSHPSGDLALEYAENFNGVNGIPRIPRKLPVPNTPESLPLRKIIERDAKSCRIGRNVIKKGGDTDRPVRLDIKEELRRYSRMLQDCALKGSLNEAKAIYGQVIKKGIDPDSHLWVSLVNAYSKCGSPECALKVFGEMPKRDVVSWTALISGYVAQGYGDGGVDLFCEMTKEGIMPNEFTLATALKACSLCLDLDFGKQVHAEAVKVGAFSDIFVGSALVDLYAKSGEMEFAESVFFGMPEQNDVSWNALLNGYAEMADGIKVFDLFCRMKELGMKVSKFNLSTVLKGCANSGKWREGQTIQALAIRTGCELDDFMSCSLVDMYSKCGRADDALKVFMRIRDPDTVTWSAIIACLAQQGKNHEAANLFCLMQEAGLRPNQFTLASVVSAATDLGDLCYAESIHAVILKSGYESDNTVGNALVTMYMKNVNVQAGSKVFEVISDQDIVSWNALLSGFQDKFCDQGPRIFNEMLLKGFKPNMYTIVSILRSCSSLSCVGFGKQVHAHIVKSSLDATDFVGTALVDMYAKAKCLEDGAVVFHTMIERDAFTWTTMISSYAQTDQAEKALKCFTQMQREGVKPNEFTLASCLSCCSHIAALEMGQQLHSRAIKSGQLDDLFVASALVDMYGKCGCIEDAEAIFEVFIFRDTIFWNTIICGYAQHGEGEKALKAFSSMIDSGIMPDKVTFLGVLSACSHMGLVEEGKEHFNSLSNVYGIVPTIDHHACMVDILGRAGRFDEVKNFVEERNLTPNALIWETVLGSCKLHGNVEFGKIAAERLFELVPEMEYSYILLSNIFASKRRWDDVRKVRALMSTQGVKKEPGCSWVEVDGRVHVFLSQDSSHPKVRDIYLKLEELSQKLSSVGYSPKTEHVLHNMSEKEKKENLLYHSERLALAFALLSINPRKTIRIYKNLRICEDCHDVMKLISDFTSRKIVVRDIKHFHHFENGACSCEDHW